MDSKEQSDNPTLTFIFDITTFCFIIACITFIVFLLIDTLNPGFISDYFDLNILKYIVLFFGVMLIFKKR